MEEFKAQLEDFGATQTFDLFIARYHPIYQHTAKYVEKRTLGYNLSIDTIMAMEPELLKLNEDNFNIYIRPNNYMSSNLIVLDDYYTSTLLHNKIELDFCMREQDFSISFSILTSVDLSKKNKEKNAKKYNYQLGIEFNPSISAQHKSFLLETLCEELECDSNHAKISKYLRAAGFFNKKYWISNPQLSTPEQKNTKISYLK